MPLFRCTNCVPRRDFESATRSCDRCGLDPAKDPRDARLVFALEIIHYDAPDPKVRGRGVGHAACNPALRVGGKVMASGLRFNGREEPIVNCPACLASDAFKADIAPADGITTMKLTPVAVATG